MSNNSSLHRFNEIFKVLKDSGLVSGVTPEKLYNTLEKLGPTFIKIGQILSTRVDLLPNEYCDALSRLRSNVAPMPYQEIEKILKAAAPGKRSGCSRFSMTLYDTISAVMRKERALIQLCILLVDVAVAGAALRIIDQKSVPETVCGNAVYPQDVMILVGLSYRAIGIVSAVQAGSGGSDPGLLNRSYLITGRFADTAGHVFENIIIDLVFHHIAHDLFLSLV